MWSGIEGNPNAKGTISNNTAVNEAAAKTAAWVDKGPANLEAPSDLVEFVRSIAEQTAKAKIGGNNQDYEKLLALGRNENGELIVTAIGLVGEQGGKIGALLDPKVDLVGFAHLHYTGLAQPPHKADQGFAKNGIPAFVIGRNGRNAWEIGKVNGEAAIRTIRSNGSDAFGAWEKYQSNPEKYKIYSPSKYPKK